VVSADPRVTMSAADYETQLAFSLVLRDEITRLTGMVEGIRSVRAQTIARRDLVKANASAADWVKRADALLPRLDDLEGKLHNPKAEVVYDILAFKGGAMLYSRLSPLYSFVIENDGVPTQGAREVFTTYKGEMDALASEWKALLAGEIAALNQMSQPAIVIP
jgi:hypothetical protein